MVRKVFIVSPDDTETYERLRRVLVGEKDVGVIYDRRGSKLKQLGLTASIWSRVRLAGVGDRRTPSHVDSDLRVRGWAVARVDDATLIDELTDNPRHHN